MTAAGRAPRSIVFIHSSDELYGADRILLELLAALPSSIAAQVWLPTDLPHPETTLCAELERRGVQVRHLDVPILRRAYRTPRELRRLAGRTRRLIGQLRAAKVDTVYCTTSATLLCAVAARAARVHEVVCHVQEFWSGADRRVLTPLAGRCASIIAISQAVADGLPAKLAARAVVVANATPDPGESPPPDPQGGPLRYLVASRWNGWKGHRTLLAAWELAGCPGVLTVLGGPPMSGDTTDVRGLAAALSAPESVEIVGEVPDASAAVLAADVIVMPSDDPEPFGLVAIEAFARSRPVIASGAGGLAEIVTDGVDGWVFVPRDAEALAAILRTLDRTRVAAAGAQARITFERRYTVTRFAAQWRAALGLREQGPASSPGPTGSAVEA